jgi:hypothetical protein
MNVVLSGADLLAYRAASHDAPKRKKHVAKTDGQERWPRLRYDLGIIGTLVARRKEQNGSSL